MKPIRLLALGALALSALTGCHRHSYAQYARTEYCRENPESIEVFVDQAPNRPYRVIGMVDAPFTIGAGHRVTKMQVNACRIGADAIIDQSDGPVVEREERVLTPLGTVVEARVQHAGRQSVRALAIKYTDAEPAVAVLPPSPPPPPAAPLPEPEEEETPAPTQVSNGNIQIQARGIQIQAPSVEVRTLPAR